MNKKNKKKIEVPSDYLEDIKKPLYTLNHTQLRGILDTHWYPMANKALENQRKIWDYSYLAYKGIMMDEEINRTRRSNKLGIYVNVPRPFMMIEGVNRNFNISKLKVSLNRIPGMNDEKRNNISSFLNYDIKRGGTFEQIKTAGFYQLLYGNGFLFSYLADRSGRYGKITGEINKKTGVVKNSLDKEATSKYFGMVSRAVSPYKIFPDPDGITHNFNDAMNQPCNFTCIRDIKHISTFRRDWAGIIPDEILDDVKPGGEDMINYESVKETIDELFNTRNLKYDATLGQTVSNSKVKTEYNSKEYVEERIWVGEDFLIVQAGAGLKFCLISPNPDPRKNSPLTKLDNVGMPDEYWKMGYPYQIRHQHIEENRLHNITLDSLLYGITGMMGIQPQYLEDQDDTEQYPGKVWKLKAMPGVKIDEVMQNFQPSTAGVQTSLKFIDEVKKITQSTTAITDFVTGASKSIADTATEATKLSGASDLAIVDQIKRMADGALKDIAKIYLSYYPEAYSGEKIEAVMNEDSIVFVGEKMKTISEKKLTDLLVKYKNPNNIIFLDEVDISQPIFTINGDVSADRAGRLAEWSSAINFAKSINEVAYNTGDPRRLDTIKMGMLGLENFDVVGDPNEFLMEEQPVKSDEIVLNAEMNAQAGERTAQAKDKGGRPKENKVTKPQTDSQRMNQKAQPSNTGKNRSTGKNQ